MNKVTGTGTGKVTERYKLTLLRHAARRGPRAAAVQAAVSVRDRLWSHRYLVFRYDIAVDGVPEAGLPALPDGLTCRAVSRMAELGPETLAALAATGNVWGQAAWLERGRGWTLWLAETEGRPLCSVWWRPAAAAGPYHCPVPPGSVLVGPIATLPEARGGGLSAAVMRALIADLAERGTESFFIDCRDYNLASRRTIERAGFRLTGTARVRHLDGRQAWLPKRPERAR